MSDDLTPRRTNDARFTIYETVTAQGETGLHAVACRVQMAMLRRQDGCEKSHRGQDWHVHESVIEGYERAIRAALAAPAPAGLDVELREALLTYRRGHDRNVPVSRCRCAACETADQILQPAPLTGGTE